MKDLRKRLVLALFGLAAAGCGPQRLDSFLYDPVKAPPGDYQVSTAVIPTHESLTIPSGSEMIDVEFIPASNAPGAHPDVTMIYFHGQSNDVGTTWPRLELLYPLGVNLAAVDPRGYGKSTGTPSEAGIHADLQAVWDALPAMKGLDPAKFVIYGRSLGAAFAIDLAAARTPAALVTESAFASVAAMVRDGVYVDLPPGFVADSRWDNLAKIPTVAPRLTSRCTASPTTTCGTSTRSSSRPRTRPGRPRSRTAARARRPAPTTATPTGRRPRSTP